MLWTILCSVLLGALAGWLANKIMKRRKKGFLGNLVLGVIGSVVGGLLASLLGISGGLLVQLLVAVGGACLVLLIVNAVRK